MNNYNSIIAILDTIYIFSDMVYLFEKNKNIIKIYKNNELNCILILFENNYKIKLFQDDKSTIYNWLRIVLGKYNYSEIKTFKELMMEDKNIAVEYSEFILKYFS